MIVVEERFAHPHVNDIGQVHSLTLKLPHRENDLREDFARREISNETHSAGRAENTAHRTTHLCGDTNRMSPFIMHQDGLDVAAIMEFEEKLLSLFISGGNCLA